MVARPGRTGLRTRRTAPYANHSLPPLLMVATWTPVGVAGIIGILCVLPVISDWTADVMAIAMIGLGSLNGISALLSRRTNLALSCLSRSLAARWMLPQRLG